MGNNNLKIENRGFLFVDLQDSMPHVDQLGLLPYSEFINHAFEFIEQVRKEYAFIEVHQYTGAAVIFTWQDLAKSGLAIKFFQICLKKLEENRDFFESNFDAFPYFSAAMNVGEVVKSSVQGHSVFYGNTMNSTARLQALCKHYERQILISEQVYEICPDLNFEYINRVYLKGLPTAMVIYSIT
jgi:adenylate cyclase